MLKQPTVGVGDDPVRSTSEIARGNGARTGTIREDSEAFDFA